MAIFYGMVLATMSRILRSYPFPANQINTEVPQPLCGAWSARRVLNALLGVCLSLAAAGQGAVAQTESKSAQKPKTSRPVSAQASGQGSAKSTPQAKPKKIRKSKPSKPSPAQVQPLVGSGPAYDQRAEAMAFAQEMAERRSLPLAWVQQAMGQAHLSPQVIRLMQPPASPLTKNWRIYRSRFLDQPRIAAGVAFWRAHASELARAEKTYGVPASIVVGILGVETIYGREMGRFRVLDALSTLAFDFPTVHPRAAERQAFFRKELEHFLVQKHAAQQTPTAALGSFAGARGMPQFMPSSRLNFAVDFDRDGRIDLSASTSDVIGSVANYLRAFNWQPGMPTHYLVQLDAARLNMDALMAPDILPTFSVASFVSHGAVLQGQALTHAGPLALIELLNGPEAASYVAGTENFYAITRYNWSSYYAMAVIELGEAVAKQMQSKP